MIADDLPEPEELATEAIAELEGAIAELNSITELLENGAGTNETVKSIIKMKRKISRKKRMLIFLKTRTCPQAGNLGPLGKA